MMRDYTYDSHRSDFGFTLASVFREQPVLNPKPSGPG